MLMLKLKAISTVAIVASLSGSAAGVACAQGLVPDDIIGIWETEDGNLKLEMFDAGGTYSARILHGALLLEEDGKTYKKDSQNPDPALRQRTLEGLIFITGLAWDDHDHRWEDGRLYQANSGRTFSAQITLDDEMMELRGYMGRPMLGRTTTLRRVAP